MPNLPKQIKFRGGTYVLATPGVREWPVYADEAQKERDQVEAVFNLGGGELEKESWAGQAYWYDGVPEYAHDDFPDWHDGGYHTVLAFGGGQSLSPLPEIDDNGAKWVLVGSFASSGEADCPACGSGVGGAKFFAEHFIEHYGTPPAPTDRCSLCEYEVKDMPGFVYIGEGFEAIYKSEAGSDEHDEDY